MATSKFMRSSFPLGNDMLHVLGRFSSQISKGKKEKYFMVISQFIVVQNYTRHKNSLRKETSRQRDINESLSDLFTVREMFYEILNCQEGDNEGMDK